MPRASRKRQSLDRHVARLRQCRRCPRMFPPPVSGGAVVSKVMLVGQAPGVKEPVLGKPFAWTAGRTLFGWFQQFCGMNEEEVRAKIYFAAVCRCFPGKTAAGRAKAGRRLARHPAIQNRRRKTRSPIARWEVGQFARRSLRRRVRRWTFSLFFRMTTAKVLTRADLPESDKWDLTHLFTGADK